MNMTRLIRGAVCLLFFMAFVSPSQGIVVDVKQHGAIGDCRNNDGPAIMKAWQAACGAPEPSTLVIPPGIYLALPDLLLEGPCKAPITIKAQGATIKAPPEVEAFKSDCWVVIRRIDRLTMLGGTFDGQGQIAWTKNDCHKNHKCNLPINVRFDFVTNSSIVGLTSLNSKFFHINVLGCDNTLFRGITVDAPAESKNTDGIHIGRACGVQIIDSHIKTGDDCISFGDGSKNVLIEKVTCGPGHGISIGSLGKYKDELPVEGIIVKNCTMTGTSNGVRIKTWPNSVNSITATNMHFEDICVNDVETPISIDQEYCPWNLCNLKVPSKVKISNVSFKGIRGTSTLKEAVKLICSKGLGCDNVVLSDIDISYHGKDGDGAVSVCGNVKPALSGRLIPPPCTVAHVSS